ncbi:tellurium resistance protein [Deltaproteobacteria bacterium]|nr:tellurium resistance protein [Deltaproteobacteria bacterium]
MSSRRLPIFFVLDCSESMAGDNLKKMGEAMNMITKALRQDPHALETVYLSVIAFAGRARTIAPLIEVASFYPPNLPLGSGTALGGALTELMKQIEGQVRKSTPDQKGDWKPIIYLLTDGKPTDKIELALKQWQAQYAKNANLIAIAMGQYADVATLQKVTDNVLQYEEHGEEDFKKFIDWVTLSVKTQSQSVTEGKGDDLDLSRIDDSILTLAKKGDPPRILADKDCVVLTGRCRKSKKLYIMKYDRSTDILPFNNEVEIQSQFQLTGCYPLSEEYFDWSAPEAANLTVNTNELRGVPGCPYCGAATAFAHCGCGKLMCLDGPGAVTCPWCGAQASFSPGGGGGDGGGFDVQRGRG